VTGLVLTGDVGRTSCRVALFDGSDRIATAAGTSGASLADPDGVERILGALRTAMAELPPTGRVTAVVVGTTGLAQAPTAAVAVAEALRGDHPDAAITLASDVLTAHVGALGGGPGVCLVAGTGAVALARRADGRARIVDGHGYLLGDDGSGFAVGRAGLRAALRHLDGRPGGSVRLADAAERRFGALAALPGTLQGDPDAVRLVAGFSVQVAAAARAGDEVAAEIWRDAVAALADTAAAACRWLAAPDPVVGLAGSLFDLEDLVTDPLRDAIGARCGAVTIHRALGDALDGARVLVGLDAALETPLTGDQLLLHRP
jgi:N-acetylglucosamine kinase-like BadF-type ATPase